MNEEQVLLAMGFIKHGNDWIKEASCQCREHVPGAALIVVNSIGTGQYSLYELHVRDKHGSEIMRQLIDIKLG